MLDETAAAPLEPSTEDAARFRGFLADFGYTEERLLAMLRSSPSVRRRNVPLLMERSADTSVLNTLARLFYIGVDVPEQDARKTLPPWAVEFALENRLVELVEGALRPQVMLWHYESRYFAADKALRVSSVDSGDLILGINPSTSVLHRFTLRHQAGRALDFGSGSGVQAILLAERCGQVAATDINPRAAAFGRFNARLNGVANVDFHTGDGFAPLGEEKFDLIVSNPPFFITPPSDDVYCANPLELDDFCRLLARQSAERLTPGGFFQMTFEWVEIEGEPWQERLRGWVESAGCDAWILREAHEPIEEYAHRRLAETRLATPEQDLATFREWLDHFRKRRVVNVHGGLFLLRKREGANWIRIDEDAAHPPNKYLGDIVLRCLEAEDWLRTHDDDALADARPRLVEGSQLLHRLDLTASGWRLQGAALSSPTALADPKRFTKDLATFVSRLTGEEPLGRLVSSLASEVNVPVERVRTECFGLVRTLLRQGFLAL